MAENGILEYQGMNQAIYRGATSNIVVDTQSMSIEIGAGNTSHTSNLHFECNHAANTASIQLNSNVVTEFSRSKKLIKYPRVALTGSTSGGYTAQTSSFSVSSFDAWYAFDNTEPADGTSRWRTANDRYTNSGATPPSEYLFTGSEAGDWISIQLPEKMKLVYYTMTGIHTHTPQEGIIYGYDSDTSTWHRVSTFYFNTEGTSGNTLLFSPEFHTEEGVGLYSKYAMIVTKTNGHGSPSLYEWKLYGIPEYDPDADGVDVVVKSVPNVPNADWLEVYYDAKDLTGVPSPVLDLSGNGINGTATNVTVSDGAFVFDGTSDIRSTVSTFTGDQPHTMSVWVNISTSHTLSDGYICVLAPSTGENLNQVSTIRYQNDGFNLQSWGNDIQMYNIGVEKGRWYHLVAVYDGGGVTTSSKRLYIDTVQNTRISGDSTTGDEIDFANTTLSLGSRVDGTSSHLTGSIANFRLFNRALSQDEIYQLYAYQKEYFGHGDLSMTLKAGRLGIGTSEPRAALDVRGIAKYENVYYYASASDPTNFHNSGIPTYINVHERSNGGLVATDNGTKIQVTTPEAAGVYVVWCTVSVKTDGTQSRGIYGELYKNDTIFARGRDNLNHITSSTYTQIVSSGLIDLKMGDKIYHQTNADSAAKVHVHDTYFYMYRIST